MTLNGEMAVIVRYPTVIPLDKFWSDQDVLFDYKANLHGIGNRSIIY